MRRINTMRKRRRLKEGEDDDDYDHGIGEEYEGRNYINELLDLVGSLKDIINLYF
jgi:hypothetical protein